MLDTQILNETFGTGIVTSVTDYELSYKVRNQLTPMTITFERIQGGAQDVELVEEDTMLLIKSGAEVIRSIEDKILIPEIQSLQELHPDKKLSLLIVGLKKYCESAKPRLSRIDIERALTKLQLCTKTSHRLFESEKDVGLVVAQFGKSIAESAEKRQKSHKMELENLYFANENRDCVKVQDKVGLVRLWQQHLIKLPLVTLETAQAIINVYPMPRNLIEAYKSSPDPVNLLRDVPIRRATTRRIGPEMSRKIYNFYSSLNASELLN